MSTFCQFLFLTLSALVRQIKLHLLLSVMTSSCRLPGCPTMTSSQINYVKEMEVYWGRCGQHIHQALFDRLASSGVLASVRSLLSVGPADGYIDEMLISTCFPRLKRYIGVDPDMELCNVLVEKMRTRFPDIRTTVHCRKIQV